MLLQIFNKYVYFLHNKSMLGKGFSIHESCRSALIPHSLLFLRGWVLYWAPGQLRSKWLSMKCCDLEMSKWSVTRKAVFSISKSKCFGTFRSLKSFNILTFPSDSREKRKETLQAGNPNFSTSLIWMDLAKPQKKSVLTFLGQFSFKHLWLDLN